MDQCSFRAASAQNVVASLRFSTVGRFAYRFLGESSPFRKRGFTRRLGKEQKTGFYNEWIRTGEGCMV